VVSRAPDYLRCWCGGLLIAKRGGQQECAVVARWGHHKGDRKREPDAADAERVEERRRRRAARREARRTR
jgi:hypothetical protein